MEFYKLERLSMGRLQDHRWCDAALPSFLPAACAQTPSIPIFETWKIKIGSRCDQVVSLTFGVLQEGWCDNCADGVDSVVSCGGATGAVAKVARERVGAAGLQGTAEHVALHDAVCGHGVGGSDGW